MKKVYFYLQYVALRDYDTSSEIVSVDTFDYGTYGTIQSEEFSSLEEALASKKDCQAETSPVMEGWVEE